MSAFADGKKGCQHSAVVVQTGQVASLFPLLWHLVLERCEDKPGLGLLDSLYTAFASHLHIWRTTGLQDSCSCGRHLTATHTRPTLARNCKRNTALASWESQSSYLWQAYQAASGSPYATAHPAGHPLSASTCQSQNPAGRLVATNRHRQAPVPARLSKVS